MKTIKLNQVGYLVTGYSDLTLWGGGNACIQMSPFEVDKNDIDLIKSKLNDNGFGVQSINGAICDIWELYQHGVKTFIETVLIGEVSDNTIENYNFE